MLKTPARIAADGDAPVQRAATFQPTSYREGDHSIELCWSTGAAGLRFDWYDGEYYIEELSMEPGAVRLDRLNAGAPLLDSHRSTSLQAIIGSVVPGSVRIENGKGLCRVRLAQTDDTADAVAKIVDGHIRNVSVAYQVHEWLRTERQGETTHMLAADWEPVEVSMVAVPFDPSAQVRKRNLPMPIIRSADHDDDIENEDERVSRRSARARAVTTNRIRDLCSRSDDISRAFERDLIAQHEERPFTDGELQRAIGDELVRVREQPSVNIRRDRQDAEPRFQLRDAFADALYARLAGREPGEQAREYAHVSMIDMARALLEATGERVRWARPSAVLDQLARSGAHTTSDFTHIIANAGRRFLIEAFSQVPSPLKVLARKRDFPDFKRRYGVQAEGPSVLRHVPEGGEYKRVSINTAANGMQLGTYGEIFAITRQALINDDLGVFADMARFWARAQSETEAGFLVALINGQGVEMEEDGKALYHADHGNIAATASAITVPSLSAARVQLRGIKNRDGATLANIVPKYLLVGPAKETEAEQVLASITADAPSAVNPFSGKLELVVDPRLAGNSWRLFADPAINPVLEYGNLEGQDGLFTDARVGFDVDGVEFKARTDLGAGAVDFRGTLLNQGD
ncbi:hypothetical protein CV103_11365 [Sphingomonas fennica]|uniref:Uncharacterized protein n=1 Tax=Edaphosphingomonas fennica TaxID=114404 RepID=A0A2T4HX94_9SPHN|nr:hypothetical protein CV103_11365 [Sphingomonas fennica]